MEKWGSFFGSQHQSTASVTLGITQAPGVESHGELFVYVTAWSEGKDTSKNSMQNFISCDGKISDLVLISFLEKNWSIAPCTSVLLDPRFVPSTLSSPFLTLLWVKYFFSFFFYIFCSFLLLEFLERELGLQVIASTLQYHEDYFCHTSRQEVSTTIA